MLDLEAREVSGKEVHSDRHQDYLTEILLYWNLLEKGRLRLLHRVRVREGGWRRSAVLNHGRISPAPAWSSNSHFCVESSFLTSEIRTTSRDQDKESSFGQTFQLSSCSELQGWKLWSITVTGIFFFCKSDFFFFLFPLVTAFRKARAGQKWELEWLFPVRFEDVAENLTRGRWCGFLSSRF